MKRPEKALIEYEAELKVSPNRFNSLYGAGQAAELSNQPEKAAGYYRQLITNCANGHSTRPELVHASEYITSSAPR
jgi:hypothetical protein